MNIQPKRNSLTPETVTTGPLPGSRKVYHSPAGRPEIRVPFREITLTDPLEPPVRVYDASGPYTETYIGIDLSKGLPAVRDAWLSKREGLETYAGRAVKPEDNGLVGADKLVPPCPANRQPRSTSPIAKTSRASAWSTAPWSASPTARASAPASPPS